MKSPRLWFASASAVLLGTVVATLVVTRSGGCDDERPAVDDRTGELARDLGERRKDVAGSAERQEAVEVGTARQKFAQASEAQLAVLAAEIERRALSPTTPHDHIERLRRDYLVLREQRRTVLEAPEADFPDAALQFETQAGTIREQLDRADGAGLPR